MSGIEVLGLACNVMQIISFAHETISFCKAVYEGSSPNSQLQYAAQSLATLTEDVHRQKASKPRTASQRELDDVVKKCNKAAQNLGEEIQFIFGHHAKGSLAATLRIAAKANWRKKRLNNLEEIMQDCQRQLDTHLLARIYTQNNAIQDQKKTEFTKLDQKLQCLITSIASGGANIPELIKSRALEIIHDNRKQVASSEGRLTSHVTKTVLEAQSAINCQIAESFEKAAANMSSLKLSPTQAAVSEQKSRQLLDSLRFPGMNERRQHLHEAHTGTFSWIFQPDTLHQHRTVKAKVKITPRPGETYWMSPVSSAEDSGEEPSPPAPRVQDPVSEQDTRPWDDFEDWLKSESHIYWISGKPGSGKSTLVKFLVDSRKTTEALGIWSQGCGVLSHFFWKPGSLLQRSVKGLLLSLLHQLLSADTTFLESIFAPYLGSDFVTKNETSDWSEKELEMALFEAFKMLPYRLCIFMDGLDEVCQPEGLLSLLQLVGKLQKIPTVKLCVASRPEPALRSKLSKYHKLRLQDINAKDMTDYARDILDRCCDDSPISRRSQLSILHALVEKAEGVFLWLRLALKDLQIGILNGDDYEDLMQRLQDLPPELHELYWDMWKRQNESTRAYRDASARYFNILIEAQSLREVSIMGPSRIGALPVFHSNISLLEMMGATDAETQQSVFREPGSQLTDTLEHWERGSEAILRKCAGMIELSCNESAGGGIIWRHFPLPLHQLVFIHRSAYDFLVDTEHGRKIRSFDTSSQCLRRLSMIKGVLARLIMVPDPDYMELMLCEVIRALSTIREPELDEELQTVLSYCWQCFNSIRKRRPTSRMLSTFDFLSVAAFPKSSFHQFVLGHIKKSENPAVLATMVLRSMHYLWSQEGSIFNPEKEASDLIESLISLGADAHAIGLQMPVQVTQWFSGFVSNISPFDSFMKEATICEHVDPEYLRKCLNLFLAQRPALDHRIALEFWVRRELNHQISVDLMPHLVNNNSHLDDTDVDVYVLDVNIGFLVHAMLKRIGSPSLATVPQLHVETARPSARTVLLLCGSVKLAAKFQCPLDFRVKDSEISRLVVDMFWPWLCSNSRKELTDDPTWEDVFRKAPDYLAPIAGLNPSKLEPYIGDPTALMAEIGCEYVKAPDDPE